MENQINEAYDEAARLLEQRRQQLLHQIDLLDIHKVHPQALIVDHNAYVHALDYALRRMVSIVDYSPNSQDLRIHQLLARTIHNPYSLRVLIVMQKTIQKCSRERVFRVFVELFTDKSDEKADCVVFDQILNSPNVEIPLTHIDISHERIAKITAVAGFRNEQEVIWGELSEPYWMNMRKHFTWVPNDNVDINQDCVTGGPFQVLVDPPMSSGVIAFVVKTLQEGNMSIGFVNHNRPNGPLSFEFVGEIGSQSYSYWSNGTECNSNDHDVNWVHDCDYGTTYHDADHTIRLVADMENLTVSYSVDNRLCGRYENIPPEISFVAYLGGGGFKILR